MHALRTLVTAALSGGCSGDVRSGMAVVLSAFRTEDLVILNSLETKDSKRILELDGLRAFAILSVFMYHALALPLSWMGVDIFFVLSGFLITGILLERKLKPGYFSGFYSSRARRILAPYCLLLVLSTVLFGSIWMKQRYWYAFLTSNIASAFHRVPHESLDG